jgi:protocatechuate 3,4-dioxygenase beta subunit
MIECTPDTITDAVLEQMGQTPNLRLKEIMAAAVKHLHAFAREVKLTPAEWLFGIDFLTRVGHASSAIRQEFILLSDTLGVSALVNALHDSTALEEATHTSLLGPFFRENAPELASGEQIAKDDPAEEILLWGRVTDVEGRPLRNAQVTIWQTSSTGAYDVQVDPTRPNFRGVFHTDDSGQYLARTVRPLGYFIPMDGPVGEMIQAQRRHGKRPAHIHFLICSPGYRELVTALYLAGDEHLDDDVVFGAAPDLVVREERGNPDAPLPDLPSIRFDFTLSRASEADLRTGRVGADPAQIAAPRESPQEARV